MANNSKADVFMLFGVEGGDNLTTGSGQLIAETLESIMNKVEATVTNHLTIKLSEQSLDTLREQIESTVTEALTSIKGTPVELTFSFDQKSVDKAFKEIKQQIKEQNITFTSQPQEKKPKQSSSGSTGSTGSTSTNESTSLENTKKEAEEAAATIEDVFVKAFEKIDTRFQSSVIAKQRLEILHENIARTFSTDEINLFLDTLDRIETNSAMESFAETLQKANSEAADLTEITATLQSIISGQYSISIPSAMTTATREDNLSKLSTLKRFINSKPAQRRNGSEMTSVQYKEWLDKQGIDVYGNKIKGIVNSIDDVRGALQGVSAAYQDIINYTQTNDLDTLSIKDYKGIKQTIEAETKYITESRSQFDQFNRDIREAAQALNITIDGGMFEVTLDQLTEMCERFPQLQPFLQEYVDIIQHRFASDTTSALDSVEQKLADVATAEDKAVKGAEDLKYELSTFTESKFLEVPQKAANAANLTQLFPDDVSAFMGSDAQNPSNAEEVLEKARQIREAREAAAKAAAEEAEAIRQRSETSEDDIDDIRRRTDAIEDETDAIRENTDALEENEQELGDARRDGLDYERTVLSHSSTYAPNGVTHSVTTRGADTGSVYTDITKRVIGKDGSEQVLTTLKSTDAQINKTIENLFKKITILREQMGRIPEEYTSEIKAALDSTEQLVSAMSEAAAGEPDKMNGMNFTDIREAEAEAERSLRSINVQLGDAKKKVAEVRKEATSAEKAEARALDKIDETLARADAKRIQITRELASMTSEYATQFGYAGEQQEGINENIGKLEQLKLSIEEYVGLLRKGEDTSDFWKDRIPGVTNLDSAVKELNKTLALTESELAILKGDSTAVTDEAARVAVNQYNKAIKDFNSAQGHERFENLTGLSEIDATNLEEVRRNYSAITSATRELTTATSQLNSEYREEQNNLTQRNKIFQEAKNYYDKYQSGIKANIELNQRWLKLMQQVHDGEINNEEARRALAELQTATKDANAETMTLWGSLKKLFTDHFGSVSATAAIGVFRNILRGAYQNVLDIDKAMTELKKVTDLAESQYVSFQNRAADMAREVGGTIADTISSTADYARLGYSLLDSEALAKAALTYKNVGDGIESIDEATASIISTIKAYNIEAKDAMQVVDLYNLLGNSLPISSGALGTALQKSASALAAANNTLAESAALISAANSVVQNEEVTGTAMKTISMYLRAAKTEAEEAGIETDGMADSVAKLRQSLLDLANVDIMLDDDTFKSTYQIIKELSEVWDEITDVSQANILEKIGGKRNANINAALIENFDIAEKALALSQNAAGSALEENEKYLESIEGHINKLKVSYEDLSQTVISSDLVKIGIDALTTLTSGAADLIKQFGTLQTIIPIIAGGLSAFKNVGRGKVLPLKREYADCDVVVTRSELMLA